MKRPCLLFGLLAILSVPVGRAEEPRTVELNEVEQSFADQMSGASLVGAFTLSDDQPPKPERYDLGEVRRMRSGWWVFPTRIRYGEHDLTVPITLPVEWAGDTAVIVVDKLVIPGLGEFSARVMIHDGRYAGYWSGGGHGGHLFGVVERAKGAKRTATEGAPAAEE